MKMLYNSWNPEIFSLTKEEAKRKKGEEAKRWRGEEGKRWRGEEVER